MERRSLFFAVSASAACLALFLIVIATGAAHAVTLTVDDSGGAQYTKIQDAMNASSAGDTIYVYNGTYDCRLNISKSITLAGENASNTSLLASGAPSVVEVNANYVNISGFEINGTGSGFGASGINVRGSWVNVSYNKICAFNGPCIFVAALSDGCTVAWNNITESGWIGAVVQFSYNSTFSNNTLSNCDNGGAEFFLCSNNTISDNSFFDTGYASLSVYGGSQNTIERNRAPRNQIIVTGDNNLSGNTVNERPVLYYKNINASAPRTVIENASSDNIILYNCTGFDVRNNTMRYGGIVMAKCKSVSATNNTMLDSTCAAVYLDETSGADVSCNNMTHPGEAGIYLTSYSDRNVLYFNTIRGADLYGIFVYDCIRNTISSNEILDGRTYGVYIAHYSHYTSLSSNNIYGNADSGLFVEGAQQSLYIDARSNWWGSESGPHHDVLNPQGAGDRAAGMPQISPWAYEPYYAGASAFKNTTVRASGGADYTTIQAAIDASPEGGTVFVYAGNYRETPLINKPLRLLGESADNTTINCTVSAPVLSISADNVTVKGFTIKTTYLYGFYPGINVTGRGARIRNNTIRDNRNYGVMLNFDSGGCSVLGNYFSNNYYGGVYVATTSEGNNISANTFVNTAPSWYGIHLEGSNNSASYNNMSGGRYIGIYLSASSGNMIYRNMVSGFNESGLYLSLGSSNNMLEYNTVDGCARGLDTRTLCNNNTIRENRFANASQYGIYLSSSSTGNILSSNTALNATILVYGENTARNNTVDGLAFLQYLNINASSSPFALENLSAFGITLYNCSGIVIRNSSFEGGGVILSDCWNITIEHNTFANSKANGVFLVRSARNNITSNVFLNSSVKDIYITDGSDSNTVTLNRILNRTASGQAITIDGAVGNIITDNLIGSFSQPASTSLQVCRAENYTVSWAAAQNTVSYMLLENGAKIYNGTATSYFLSGKPNGTYVYDTFAWDASGIANWTNSVNITVAINIPPFAGPIAVQGALSGEAVDFAASALDQDGSIANWTWDFGDAQSLENAAYTRNASHAYAVPGNYTARLAVRDNDGAAAQARTSFTVSNRAPSCSFSPPSGLRPGEQAVFNASASDADGSVAAYSWDFGDGNVSATSAQASAAHQYTRPGTFNVTLTVIDNNGTQASYAADAVVQNIPPISRILRPKVYIGKEAQFLGNASTDQYGQIVNYTWDFDDGTPLSYDMNPLHTYNNSGTYNVVLVVRDDSGGTVSSSETVTVEDTSSSAGTGAAKEGKDILGYIDEYANLIGLAIAVGGALSGFLVVRAKRGMLRRQMALVEEAAGMREPAAAYSRLSNLQEAASNMLKKGQMSENNYLILDNKIREHKERLERQYPGIIHHGVGSRPRTGAR